MGPQQAVSCPGLFRLWSLVEQSPADSGDLNCNKDARQRFESSRPTSCELLSVHQHSYSFCHFPTGSTFEGGEVEAYTLVKSVDYPRDPTTNEMTASIHSQLQVQYAHQAERHACISLNVN